MLQPRLRSPFSFIRGRSTGFMIGCHACNGHIAACKSYTPKTPFADRK